MVIASITVEKFVKNSRLLRAKVNSLQKSHAKNSDTTMSMVSIAAMVYALASALAGVGLRYDCHTKLTHDQMAPIEFITFSSASMFGFRKRNDDRIRLNERDGKPRTESLDTESLLETLDCVLVWETAEFTSTLARSGFTSLEFKSAGFVTLTLSHLFALLPTPFDAPSPGPAAGSMADGEIGSSRR